MNLRIGRASLASASIRTRFYTSIALAMLTLMSSATSANMLDTEPQTRNSSVISTPEAVKLEPFTGSAVYSYKFELPPGTGGLTPDLVLSFSTLTRGTEYGWGWSLNLSRIERSTRFGPPSYNDAADQFEIDGEVLIRDPSIANRFHRTRTDFSRMQYFPSGGTSTSYCEVTKPDGLKMRYGAVATAKSRLTTGSGLAGSTFRWLLDEVVDARGNSYRIEYSCDPDGGACSGVVANVYPIRIRYSFRSSSEAPSSQTKRTLRLVTFDWEERGEGNQYTGEDRDQPTSFRPGFKTQIRLRLAGVRIGIDADGDGILEGTDQVRRYELKYTEKFRNDDEEDEEGRRNPPFSQLASIQRFGVADSAGSDSEFPSSAHPAATRFSYNRPGRGFAAENAKREVWTPPANGPEGGAIRYAFNALDVTAGLWDMNGDGLLDRVKTRPNQSPKEWKVNFGISLAGGGLGYGEAVKWKWCSSAGQTNCPTTISAAESVKDRLVNVRQSSDEEHEWTYIRDDIVDMDGDSLPDRVSVDEDGNWTFRRNLGDRFGEERNWDGPNLTTGNTDIDPGEITRVKFLNSTKKTNAGTYGSWETRARIMDMNGDGRPDHVAATPNNTSKVYVSFNLGCQPAADCGFGNPVELPGRLAEPGSLARRTRSTVQYPFQYDYENILDMNGDGFPDMVFRRNAGSQDCLEVGFGKGAGFQTYTSTGYTEGSQDCRSGSTAWVTHDLSFEDNNSANNPNTHGITVDVNGDGIVDRLHCAYVNIALCDNRVALGLGDGTFTKDAAPWNVPTYSLRVGETVKADLIDLDGDGLVENVETTDDCDNCPSSDYTWEIWDNLAAATGPEWLLSSITNEFGGQTSIVYESSARMLPHTATSLGRTYAPEGLSASTMPSPQHAWVVKSLTQSDGRVGTPLQQHSLSYAEPRYDYALRETRGFRMSESTDAASTVTRSLFHQAAGRRGMTEYQEVISASQVLSAHETFYSTEAPKNETGAVITGSYFVYPAYERTSLFSAGARQDHSFIRVFEPMFGNLLQEYDLGSDGLFFSPDDLATVSEFDSPDTDKWLIRLPRAHYQQFPGLGGERINNRTFEYVLGLVSKRTTSRYDPVGLTSEGLVETWGHDEFGNTTSYRPPSRGISSPPQVETTWDSNFSTFPVVIRSDDGAGVVLQTRYAFNPALGEVEKKLDPMGHLECWLFDQFGRLAERSDLGTSATDLAPLCDMPRATYMFSDDPEDFLGNPDAQYLSSREYSWPARSIESRQYFDGLGRVYRDAKQAKSTDYFVTARAFGSRGELSCESEPVRLGAPLIAASSCGLTSTAAPSRLTSFDALLRPTQHTTRLASGAGDRVQETVGYSIANQDGLTGNELIESHTALGSPSPNVSRQIGKDPRGDVLSVLEVGGGTTYIRRDPAGRIKLVDGPDVAIAGGGTDANLLALTYNTEGQRVAFARPSSIASISSAPKTTYAYDADGNLRQTVPARGATLAINYSYDGLSRLRFKDVAPANSIASAGATDTLYQYESSDYGAFPGKLGRTNGAGVDTHFGYDHRGRTVVKKRSVAASGMSAFETRFAFDLLDRNIATGFPDRSFIARKFDGSLLASIHDPTQPQYLSYRATNNLVANTPVLADGIEFHPTGALQTAHFVRGNVSIANSFAPADYRPSQSETTIPGLPVEWLVYGFDTAGNVTSIDDSTNLLDESFSYDALHRLASVTATGAQGYAPSGMVHEYDPAGNGNLTRKGDLLLGYGGMNAGPHAVTEATTPAGFVAAYTYDLDGNVSGKALGATNESEVFGHDAENRLVSYSYVRPALGTGSGSYQYDDTGARVSRSAFKTDVGAPIVTTVDPEYEVDHQNQRTRVHVFLGGTRMATIERALTSATSGPPSPIARELHLHANHLGTPRLITDQTGAIVQRTLLKPFGEVWKVLDGAGNALHPALRPSSYLFTGQHEDVESSLHYFGARHYDPLVGRFMEVDPELVGPAAGVTFERIWRAPQSLDAYGYASNSPTNRVDPTGAADQEFGCSACFAAWGGNTIEQGRVQDLAIGSGTLIGSGLLLGGLAAFEAAPVALSTASGWALRDPHRAGQTIGQGVEALFGEGPGSFVSAAGGAVRHAIPEARLGHIFRLAEGHVLDSPENRQLLLDVADDVRTTLGADRFGNVWSAVMRTDGTQVWVQARNGQIWNGGVNQTPRVFSSETGLSAR